MIFESNFVVVLLWNVSIGYLKSNPFHQQDLKTFARQKGTYYALIVPLNSPLKPILQKASNALLEAGTMDHLVKLWEGMFVHYSCLRQNVLKPVTKWIFKGHDIPNIGEVETTILTPGQVILSFLIMIGVIGASVLVFLCELAYKRFKNMQTMNYLGIDFNGKDVTNKGVEKIEGPILKINDFFRLWNQIQNKSNVLLLKLLYWELKFIITNKNE